MVGLQHSDLLKNPHNHNIYGTYILGKPNIDGNYIKHINPIKSWRRYINN